VKKFAKLVSFVLALVLMVSLTSCGNEPSETSGNSDIQNSGNSDEPIVLKLAWAETADPKGHPVSGCVDNFKKEVEEKSNGRILVELYPAGQLGDQQSTLQQVEQGIIQSSLCATGMIAGSYYDNFNMFEVPYMFPDVETAWEIVKGDTEFFQNLADKTAEACGIRPIALLLEGLRHTTNNKREVKSPDDMTGLKIRTMEVPAHMELFKALGASPTPIAWAELYSALQTGVVDGQENPLFNIQYAKLYEVQKYLTLDGHITLLNTWFINDDFYNSLDDDLKSVINECAYSSSMVHRQMVNEQDFAALQTLKDKGMQVYELTNEEYNQFKEATQPVVLEYIKKNMSNPEMLEDLLLLIDEKSK